MALATAALGLYGGKANAERGGAGLPPPWEESGANKFLGESIFITGGAGSVGQVGSSEPTLLTILVETLPICRC